MQNLEAIEIKIKNGEESFTLNGHKQNFSLLDFWSWSQSDLLNNTLRGVLAEFIVKKALKVESQIRTEWDAYDLETKNRLKKTITARIAPLDAKEKITNGLPRSIPVATAFYNSTIILIFLPLLRTN